LQTTARILIAVAACVAGCAGSYEHGAAGPASAVTPRSDWRISGDLREIVRAVDGQRDTAARADNGRSNSQITIDLGQTCLFNMVVVDHGPNEHGFCGRVALLTSLDGRNFTRRTVMQGTRRVTVFSLVTPTLGRHIRLQAIEAGPEAWSVGEIYVQ